MKPFTLFLLSIIEIYASIVTEISYDLKGDINNKYKIVMRLNINQTNNEVIGTYRYISNKNVLDIIGKVKKNHKLKMVERFFENGNYKITGYFDGEFKNNSFEGIWYSNNKKISYPFKLSSYFKHKRKSFDFDIKYDEKGFKTIVDIYIKEGNRTIQTIKKSYFNSPRKGKLYNLGIKLIDLNFDGYFDIKIVPCFVGCYEDEYYLYIPEKNHFEKLELPHKGVIEKIDLENRTISTAYTNGKADIYYTYKYIDNKLYMIYKKRDIYNFDNDNNYIGRKIIEEFYEIKDKKPKLIEKKEYKEENGDI